MGLLDVGLTLLLLLCLLPSLGVPQWDLSLILIAFTGAPFKPLQLGVPKFLAWKGFSSLSLPQGPEGMNFSPLNLPFSP